MGGAEDALLNRDLRIWASGERVLECVGCTVHLRSESV